jgi:hypothetical protein
MILQLDVDIYNCPHDGTELQYVPKKGYHHCMSCMGVLYNAKNISQQSIEKISQLKETESHNEVCPCCEDGSNISVRDILHLAMSSSGDTEFITPKKIWLCNNCGSLWCPFSLKPGRGGMPLKILLRDQDRLRRKEDMKCIYVYEKGSLRGVRCTNAKSRNTGRLKRLLFWKNSSQSDDYCFNNHPGKLPTDSHNSQIVID